MEVEGSDRRNSDTAATGAGDTPLPTVAGLRWLPLAVESGKGEVLRSTMGRRSRCNCSCYCYCFVGGGDSGGFVGVGVVGAGVGVDVFSVLFSSPSFCWWGWCDRGSVLLYHTSR